MSVIILAGGMSTPRAVNVGSTVNLSEQTGGWVTYSWTLMDRPEGSGSSLVGPSTPTPTLVVDSEGTYLVLLVVNSGLDSRQSATAIVYVPRLLDGRRDPAAGETIEDGGARGWAQDANRQLDDIADLRKDPGRLAGIINFNGASANFSVLYASSTATIKTGLPGQATLPLFDNALANDTTTLAGDLYLLDRGVKSGASPAAGEVIWARIHGFAYGVPIAGALPRQAIYLTNGGGLSLSAGMTSKQVARAVAVRLNDCDIEFDGHRQGW